MIKKIMKKETKADKKSKKQKLTKSKKKKLKKKKKKPTKILKQKRKKQKLTKKLKTKIEDVNINNNGDKLRFHGSVRPVCICISSRKAEQKGDFFSHISCDSEHQLQSLPDIADYIL
jgi:hypothetical protein